MPSAARRSRFGVWYRSLTEVGHAVVHLHGRAGPSLVVGQDQHDVLRGRLVDNENGCGECQESLASDHWVIPRRSGESSISEVVKLPLGRW